MGVSQSSNAVNIGLPIYNPDPIEIHNICGKLTKATIERDKEDPTMLLVKCPNGSVGLRIVGLCLDKKVQIQIKGIRGIDITLSCK
jgi:hypothetical protein